MRTFKFNIAVEGRITIPDAVLKDIRNLAAEAPVDGGDTFLNKLHLDNYENDDAFLQGALKNALRSIVRNGLVGDIGSLGDGVGYRVAPATVEVSVPENVITKVKAREQVPYGGELASFGQEGSLEQADPSF